MLYYIAISFLLGFTLVSSSLVWCALSPSNALLAHANDKSVKRKSPYRSLSWIYVYFPFPHPSHLAHATSAAKPRKLDQIGEYGSLWSLLSNHCNSRLGRRLCRQIRDSIPQAARGYSGKIHRQSNGHSNWYSGQDNSERVRLFTYHAVRLRFCDRISSHWSQRWCLLETTTLFQPPSISTSWDNYTLDQDTQP